MAIPASVVRLVLASMARLPPGSHQPRRLLRRAVARGLEAAARDDCEFGLLLYEPDVELRLFGEIARALGLAESYHGHQGIVDMWRDYKQDMDELRIEPEQIIDFGDRTALGTTAVAVLWSSRRDGAP